MVLLVLPSLVLLVLVVAWFVSVWESFVDADFGSLLANVSFSGFVSSVVILLLRVSASVLSLLRVSASVVSLLEFPV